GKIYNIAAKGSDGKTYLLHIQTLNNPRTEMEWFRADDYQTFISWLIEIAKTNSPDDLKTNNYNLIFVSPNASPDVEVIGSAMNTGQLNNLKLFLKDKLIGAIEKTP